MVLLVRLGNEPEATVSIQFKDKTLGPTEELEVTLATNELVEADVGFNGDTGSWIPEVGIAARNDGEALSFRFPREVGDSVYKPESSISLR